MVIIATSIIYQSFREYMGNPSDAALGAIVAAYVAGLAVGHIVQIFLGDFFGRRRYMQLMCIAAIIGTIFQTAAQSYTMFLVGRIVIGAATGGLSGTVAIYNSEISPPVSRGFIGGLTGFMFAFGSFLANWVGFACGYMPATSTFQWRLPTSLQIPLSIILFLGLQFFLPESPRWLISLGRQDEARVAFRQIQGNLSEVALLKEFNDMREQILFEKSTGTRTFLEAWSKYKKRILILLFVHIMTALSGINIVNYYQPMLYSQLGIKSETVLVLAGIYGTVGLMANLPSIYLLDRFGRVKLLKWGMVALCIDLIYCALMTRYFSGSDNNIGKGMAVLGIYMFTAIFHLGINSAIWLYSTEVLPVALRNKIVALGLVLQYTCSVAVTESGPIALANIGANFYYVFVATTFVSAVVISIYFPETKGKTLEEIAASFGDKVVYSDDAMGIRDCITEESK
ncbi:general substrate transporter [Desarmillaria tabescens]|uniref:General substrate transporter n=1 Tax=Armillaria tabescens TaxID=1929756 RepID=A0AA39U952_ARMTA|nr:general substrate transporter [Desarmillaria tabescens]KAK0470190.1 general substrate transporter [Desarmillaria tabescens]